MSCHHIGWQGTLRDFNWMVKRDGHLNPVRQRTAVCGFHNKKSVGCVVGHLDLHQVQGIRDVCHVALQDQDMHWVAIDRLGFDFMAKNRRLI